ncbi:MAG: triose-phosphate isomerase [Patescibacteria group bacterium]
MRIQEKNLIVVNFKMYLPDKSASNRWMKNFEKAFSGLELANTRLALCPSSIYLSEFAEKLKSEYIDIGGQDCFWQDEGAFTGGLGAKMIFSCGGRFVILGHSERRKYFAETDQQIAYKTKQALINRLHPILCIGENAEEKRQEKTKEVILGKLEKCLQFVGKGSLEEIVICYEPIWAISANNPEHPPEANEIMEARVLIKRFLVKKYGQSVADRVKIIYGGSVDSKNYKEVCSDSGMEGALIGSAGKMPYELAKVVKVAQEN